MKLIILCLLYVIIRCESHNITDIIYFKCRESIIDCSNRGVCNKDGDDCDCFNGYTTYFADKVYYIQRPRCNYQMKNQIYALVLSMFITFGSMHFYLGNFIVGYIQIIIFFFTLVFNIAAIYRLSIKHTRPLTPIQLKQSLSMGVLIAFSTFVFFMWYLFDIFMVMFAIYKDENNVEMQEMIL
jgi:hypothetical protein